MAEPSLQTDFLSRRHPSPLESPRAEEGTRHLSRIGEPTHTTRGSWTRILRGRSDRGVVCSDPRARIRVEGPSTTRSVRTNFVLTDRTVGRMWEARLTTQKFSLRAANRSRGGPRRTGILTRSASRGACGGRVMSGPALHQNGADGSDRRSLLSKQACPFSKLGDRSRPDRRRLSLVTPSVVASARCYRLCHQRSFEEPGRRRVPRGYLASPARARVLGLLRGSCRVALPGASSYAAGRLTSAWRSRDKPHNS